MQQIRGFLNVSALEREKIERADRQRGREERRWLKDYPHAAVDRKAIAEEKRARRRARNLVHCS